MILMHGVMVMKILNKHLIVQTFVEHSKKHYPFVECVEKLMVFPTLQFSSMVCNCCVTFLSTLVR
jgi:hypothetical protein